MKLQKILMFLCLSMLFQLHAFANENNCSVKIIPTPLEQQKLGAANFQFEFDNFPKNKEISILIARNFQKDLNEFRKVDTVSICDDNAILIRGNKYKSYNLNPIGFFEGEKVRYKFQLKDGSFIAATSYYPLPITKKGWKETFTVSAELVAVIPMTNYLIHFEGLEPDEEVEIFSTSQTEKVSFSIKVPSGSPMGYSPNTVNAKGGVAEFRVRRVNDDSATLELFWGSELVKKCTS